MTKVDYSISAWGELRPPAIIIIHSTNLGMTPEQLLSGPLEVNMVDGIILPNIRMTGRDEACSFLNGEGRCGIHSYRPGFCRLFPLGRLYENRSFSYFLQVHECPKDNRSKVKVRKWIDTPDVKLYEKFVNDWHYFLKDLEHGLEENGSLDIRRTVVMYVLNQFYITPYNSGEEFYPQFYRRITEASEFAARSGIKTSL